MTHLSPAVVDYSMRRWYDHFLIFLKYHGSTLPYTVAAVAFSGVLCWIYWQYVLHKGSTDKGTDLMGNPSIYGFFMQTSGVLVAFTTTICYNRFWESLTLLISWSQGLAWVAHMVLSFEGPCEKFTSEETNVWKAQIIHWISILHAVGIEQLYCSEGADGTALDILGGLTVDERALLDAAYDQPSAVVQWINNELSVRTFVGGFNIPAPIAAQVWVTLGNAMVQYANAVKFARNKVPLSFQQCLAAVDLIVLTVTPLAIASFISTLAMALVLNSVCVFVFHSIYLTDTSMQQPFGDKSRDLPLVSIHRGFIEKILTCLTYEVGWQLHKQYEEAARLTSLHPNGKPFCALEITSTLKASGQASRATSDTTSPLTSRSSSLEMPSPGRVSLLCRQRSPIVRLHTHKSQDPHMPATTLLVMKGDEDESALKTVGHQVKLNVVKKSPRRDL